MLCLLNSTHLSAYPPPKRYRGIGSRGGKGLNVYINQVYSSSRKTKDKITDKNVNIS